MPLSKDQTKIDIVPLYKGAGEYGEFQIRLHLPLEMMRKVRQVLAMGAPEFYYGQIHYDDDRSFAETEEFCISTDVRGCGLSLVATLGNFAEEAPQASFIAAYGNFRRDGDDALDGTLPAPQTPSEQDMLDALFIFKNVLKLAEKV